MKITVVLLAMLVSVVASAQSYTANVEKSTLKWNGKKVTGEHYGFIKLKQGELVVKNNSITKGKFEIDMTSISCTDIENEEYNAKLVGHLKSDDFFGVANFPTAVLEIKKAEAFKEGKANVNAHLTIKGKTNPVQFVVEQKGSVYSAVVKVDRSKYDVRYGSTSFFDNLGDKAIHNEFSLEVEIAVE